MKEMCPYEECRRVLSTPYSLKRHIDTCHNNVRKFICSHCDKKFSSQRNLWTHLAKHRVTQLSAVPRKPDAPELLNPATPVIETDHPGTDFLEGEVQFPEICEERRVEGKLPLAWRLMAGLGRGKGAQGRPRIRG